MFAGFLTLGSFLLTLQTAILQRLTMAFDTDDYCNRYLVLKSRDPNVRYYGSLERMNIALFINIILALTTAGAQMSIGFVRRNSTTAVCVGLAATTLILVAYLTFQLHLAHKEYFKKIEEDKVNKLVAEGKLSVEEK
jgi:heme/copper-type cytochrome/quinol oxidase subunit 3